jgi:hypothetical protein
MRATVYDDAFDRKDAARMQCCVKAPAKEAETACFIRCVCAFAPVPPESDGNDFTKS